MEDGQTAKGTLELEKHFAVDARALISWGRDSIKDSTTAVVELVKNSYDADATRVDIELFVNSAEPYIRIADNGTGMTDDDLNNNWLRIGFSTKLVDKKSKRKRRRTGEKGVGRLSADRLGATLALHTKHEDERPIGLQVNWNDFNQSGKDLSSVSIPTLLDPPIQLPTKSPDRAESTGTELIIRSLREKDYWNEETIEELYDELSILTPPFEDVEDFEIFMLNDINEGYNGKVKTEFIGLSEVDLIVNFDGRKAEYKLYDRNIREQSRKPLKKSITWKQLVQRSGMDKERSSSPPRCGPVELRLMFFRRVGDVVKGSRYSLSDLRTFLNKNVGVRIYRDSIRVKPYGDPSSSLGKDWLGVGARQARDPAGAGRKGFRISPNQLLGAVYISRDKNPSLIDSASREGLIHNAALEDLKYLLYGCINVIEAHYHELFVEDKLDKVDRESPLEKVKELKQSLNVVGKDLTELDIDLHEIEPVVPQKTRDKVVQTRKSVDDASDKAQGAEKSIETLYTETITSRGLATVGIASAIFGHETGNSVFDIKLALQSMKVCLESTPPDIRESLRELRKAQKAGETIADWGKFSLTRLRREKRSLKEVPLHTVIEETIDGLKGLFKNATIDLFPDELEEITTKSYEVDIEAILINLLTNAYTACLQVTRKRKVRVSLKNAVREEVPGFSLIVGDSGPGVSDEFHDHIWRPLFTTKTDKRGKKIGTGLGLAIVKAIVTDLKGQESVGTDPVLKGACFTIWIPMG